MEEVTATEASRRFSDLLDAVEHGGASFTVTRRGRVVAVLEPAAVGGGAAAKELLRRHHVDRAWREEIEELRQLLELERR